MFGSMAADFGYSRGVIRPARLVPRPLSGLAELLGVGRTASIHNESGLITGATLDSRAVAPGDLYAALPGTRTHGAAYSEQAVVAGAVAILTDPDGRDHAARAGVPVFVVNNPRMRLGDVSCWIYGDPSRRMTMIGVTGTSGKTTTSYLCEAGLRAAGHTTGLIGGVEIKIGQDIVRASLTTPEAPDLQALLAVMAERRVTAVAMEVSSHSLALGRVAGTRYDVAVFTNLSQDHLDFHSGFEDYFRAKAKLFTPAYSAVGVVNVADRYGRRLVTEASVPIVTFCADAASGAYAQADWRAADVRCGADGSTFRVVGPGGVEADASVTLPGPFNVANALGAIVALVEGGVDLADAVSGVASCPGVPGRLQRVQFSPGGATPRTPRGAPDGKDRPRIGRAEQLFSGESGAPDAFVDYSHKPGAVEAVLSALRPVTSGELIVVLGCGGDRDRGKRPLMGAAAARLADVAIFTSDNPRSEDPLAILGEMLHGVLGVPQGERARVIIEPDRAAAIDLAVARAGKGDVVLVAGKGHETGQYVAGNVLPFDDVEVTAAAIARHTDPGGTYPASAQSASAQSASAHPASPHPASPHPGGAA
jgi:UDP-N-acetylmuramoyl-L-alanyl-D-glutamate--2,6-diaminopimelate ligase